METGGEEKVKLFHLISSRNPNRLDIVSECCDQFRNDLWLEKKFLV